jgi:hypothetical protein
MKADRSRPRPNDRKRRASPENDTAQQDVNPWLGEEPTVIREDEEEVHDLGFIVEDRRESIAEEGLLTESNVAFAEAESDEADFAERSDLDEDPELEQPGTGEAGWDTSATAVRLRGHAPGVARGFGTEVPQDIGTEGFSVEENPLLVPAAQLDYPISTEALSDEARGVRDVDEMGTEAELDRLAERAIPLEESRQRATSIGTKGRVTRP